MDPQSTEERNLQDLAAVFGDHEVTNEEGQIPEGGEPSAQEPATEETKKPTEETPTAEKPAEPDAPAPKQEAEGTEPELGVDESGKRYIPEKRFKDVYGKWKETERELHALKSQATPTQSSVTPKARKEAVEVDKTEALEVEILRSKLPQFDPESDQYSETLDRLGFDILKANPGMTRIDAARRAVRYAREVSQGIAQAGLQARQVKSLQADQGLTASGGARSNGMPNPTSMSLEEMERYLKEHGEW